LGGQAPAGASGRGEAAGPDLSADLGFATPVGEVDSTPAVGGDSLAVGDIRPQDLNFGFADLNLGRVARADEAAALGVEPYSAPEPYPVPESVHTGDADLELTMADLTPATEFDLAELGVTTPTSGMPRGPTADLEIASPRDAQHGSEFGPLIALDTQPSADLAGGPLFAPDSGHAWSDLAPVPGPAPVRPERGFGGGPEAARFDIEAIEQDTDSNDLLSSQWQMEGGIWDEVATKLDLGRAYVAMDDPQAAQAILVEVAEEGNPEQQAEAREILAQLKSN
jgi:pilus assembly protein FimV